MPGGNHVAEHERVPLAGGPRSALGRRADPRADRVRGPRHGRRRDPRAAPERRRLHPAAGGLLPAGPRDLRRARRPARQRRGDLLVGPARPLLRLRALRLPAGHHHDGEGADRRLHPDGGDDRLRRGLRAVRARARRRSPTARPSAAIRSPRPSRSATSTSSPRRTSAATSARKEDEFRGMLEDLRDIPIVGDVRGAGFFHAIELVKDRETKESLQRRGGRVAAARLPLRRALPARPDLPRRRSRRPRDPARAAADLRHRAVPGDRLDPALGARGGLGQGPGEVRAAGRRGPPGC